MAQQAEYAALADWFTQHPHQRPPASGATAGLRAFLAELELQHAKGTLTPPQLAAIAHWRIPLGKGHLLPVGEEWVLLRRLANVRALGMRPGPIRSLRDPRLPTELRHWIRALRRQRQTHPDDVSVLLVQRLEPHFPWRDAYIPTLGHWLRTLGQRLLALPRLPAGRPAVSD